LTGYKSYIFEHLDGDLRIEALAKRFGMSARTFNRAVAGRLGMGPGRFVEQCRLERARRYLEETNEPVSQIAERCGYATSDGLRLAFERNLSVTPRGYRKRFSSAADALH
jgi:transcriptional regulator GlxA family with amidase domain